MHQLEIKGGRRRSELLRFGFAMLSEELVDDYVVVLNCAFFWADFTLSPDPLLR